MKKPMRERVGAFLEGKGFYIVLFLCVAAIGISGYYLFSSIRSDVGTDVPVAGQIQVTVTPVPTASQAPEHAVPTAPPQRTATPAQTQTAAAAAATPTPQTTTPPSATPAEPLVFTWPVKGEILSGFSVETLAYDATMGDWRTHSGVDIAAAEGIQVLATARGTVLSVEEDDLMGVCVTIDHGDGLLSVYANLDPAVQVVEGDSVYTGDIIGQVGNTAIAESALPSHLHFAMMKNDLPADPMGYLPDLT